MRNISQLCLNGRERYSCTDFRCRCHPPTTASSQPVMRISQAQDPASMALQLRLLALKLQMTRNLSSLLLQTTRSRTLQSCKRRQTTTMLPWTIAIGGECVPCHKAQQKHSKSIAKAKAKARAKGGRQSLTTCHTSPSVGHGGMGAHTGAHLWANRSPIVRQLIFHSNENAQRTWIRSADLASYPVMSTAKASFGTKKYSLFFYFSKNNTICLLLCVCWSMSVLKSMMTVGMRQIAIGVRQGIQCVAWL